MAWTVKLSDDARRNLEKLDKPIQKRIASFLQERIQSTDNPRTNGKALQGNLSGLWRYRVGDYRLLCRIENDELLILVIEIGHRKDVYRSVLTFSGVFDEAASSSGMPVRKLLQLGACNELSIYAVGAD